MAAGRLRGADAIGLAVGKVIGTHKMAKHLAVTITDGSLAIERRQDQIEAEAALDGIYVIRTPVPQAELDAGDVVTAYKNLKYVVDGVNVTVGGSGLLREGDLALPDVLAVRAGRWQERGATVLYVTWA